MRRPKNKYIFGRDFLLFSPKFYFLAEMKDEFDMGFLDDLILQVDEKVDTLKREIANNKAPPMKSFVLRSTSSGKIFPIKV